MSVCLKYIESRYFILKFIYIQQCEVKLKDRKRMALNLTDREKIGVEFARLCQCEITKSKVNFFCPYHLTSTSLTVNFRQELPAFSKQNFPQLMSLVCGGL